MGNNEGGDGTIAHATPRCVKNVALAVVAVLGALFLAEYLRFEPAMLGRLAVAGLVLGSVTVLVRQPKPTKVEVVVFAILSDGDTYSGLADANYISPYSVIDVIAFVFMLAVILPCFLSVYSLIKHGIPYGLKGEKVNGGSASLVAMGWRAVLLFAVVLFALWLPYLIVYYPGFVFGDTLSSLSQALGSTSLSNHHPVMYTLLIGACLKLAGLFGFGNAAGCARYCLIQMVVMASCFSYLVNWVIARAGIFGKARWVVYALSLAYFGVSPYIAGYSIARWKDPLFSTALMMLTLFLADAMVLKTERGSRSSRVALAIFALFAFVVAFFRNNGVYVLVLTAFAVALWLIVDGGKDLSVRRKASVARRQAKGMLVVLVTIAVVFFAVTGPLFDSLGVKRASNVEAFGIPINQMARVAALDGDMSASDREYLDAVLSLELYPETYRPCCTDLLKWDGDFKSAALGDGFVQHWVSMLLKNPVTYFEAWELQTFGFWTVNQPQVYEFNNIAGGAPKNNTEQLASYGIDPGAGIQNETVRELFPMDEGSIPIGAIFWLLLFLAACVCLMGKARWLVVLVPSLGLLATLLVATPIWYWPRYAAAVQFLIPVYALLFYRLMPHSGR